MPQIPKLPPLLARKIYKSGQTRGADDDVIFQNRVNRNNTVLIPFSIWRNDEMLRRIANTFEKGYIVLINPNDYFSAAVPDTFLKSFELILGINCLLLYETRKEWTDYNPVNLGLKVAVSRTPPLGGSYVARVPATTASVGGSKINLGFTKKSQKGAGIRLYEYAPKSKIQACQLQLEAIFWLCYDSFSVVQEYGMSPEDASLRRNSCFEICQKYSLLDFHLLYTNRIINAERHTICPLCLEEVSGYGFFNRLPQAMGREVPDLTVTELNLFHIDELKYGAFNHRPYNLGWGHHHCNVVVKDIGIKETLRWMQGVLDRNNKYSV